MITKKEIVLNYMEQALDKNYESYDGFTTQELSSKLGMQRTNVSSILNELVKDRRVTKSSGKPVKYYLIGVVESQKTKSSFDELIGNASSLKNSVQLAKATILYPEEKIYTLIRGENGVGKAYFASLMYEFAKEKGIITGDYVEFNTFYYIECSDKFDNDLFGDEGALKKSMGGMLYIKHAELLKGDQIKKLFDKCEENLKSIFLVCGADEKPYTTNNILESKFSIKIDYPSIKDRSLEERLEFIEKFFLDEAENVNKDIKINSELLRCLLLYPLEKNVKQLKEDIRIGCANAYVREMNNKDTILHVYVNDCHSYIRKGFLFYKAYRDKIESLIPSNYTYTFTSTRSKRKEESKFLNNYSIYDTINVKVNELKKRDVKEEDIMTIISTEIDSYLLNMSKNINISNMDLSTLYKLVDPKIVDLCDGFLKMVSAKLNRVYSLKTLCTIAMHISKVLSMPNITPTIPNEKILSVIEKNKEEYALGMRFIDILEKEFNIKFPIDESIFITMMIRDNDEEKIKQPILLIVMHGNIASSIANTVNSIYKTKIVHYYDLLLEKDINEAYEELKMLVKSLDNGQGFLMIYDMGSIEKMCKNIVLETGVKARLIEFPITTFTLDAAIRFNSGDGIDTVYESITKHGFGSFNSLKNEYKRYDNEKNKVIITLCRTGEGTALQIKKYLEKNLGLDDVEIMAMAIGDNKALICNINSINDQREVICIVGTYDPKIHDIPYISIAKVFDTPIDKLPMLLALKDIEETDNFDYHTMYEYLSEQLPNIKIHKLKRILPVAINKIRKIADNFTINEEVGLFMHIACSISRILEGEQLPTNLHRESTISRHKKIYNELIDILYPIEEEYEIKFNDDEIATIIDIIS